MSSLEALGVARYASLGWVCAAGKRVKKAARDLGLEKGTAKV